MYSVLGFLATAVNNPKTTRKISNSSMPWNSESTAFVSEISLQLGTGKHDDDDDSDPWHWHPRRDRFIDDGLFRAPNGRN